MRPQARPLHPEVYLEEDEPERKSVDPPVPAERPVTFECRSVPALGLGLPSGFHAFQYGRLTLTDARDITALRAHGWCGRQIRELTEAEAAQDPRTLDAAARWQELEKERERLAEEQRRSHLMGPSGPLLPRPTPRRRRPTGGASPHRRPEPDVVAALDAALDQLAHDA
jgi:hypothetical protein